MRSKKTKVFIGILTFMLLVLMYVSTVKIDLSKYTGGIFGTILVPFQRAFFFIDNKVKDTVIYIGDIELLRDENELLRARIDEVERENRELEEYRQKISELTNALGIKDRFFSYDIRGANIIAKEPGNWFKIFTIDVGSRDGVKLNSPVITGRGLVGRVSRVDLFTAQVVSIIDPNSTVSARITKTRDLVLLKGDVILGNQGMLRLDYVPSDIDIGKGDLIETSGYGGVFPRGIIVGRIEEVYHSETSFTMYAEVLPVADFKKLEEVFVLTLKE